jgi:hypothetical protein
MSCRQRNLNPRQRQKSHPLFVPGEQKESRIAAEIEKIMRWSAIPRGYFEDAFGQQFATPRKPAKADTLMNASIHCMAD